MNEMPQTIYRCWNDSDIDVAFSADVSKTQLYKMAGNSIVVNCLTEIFKSLKGCE